MAGLELGRRANIEHDSVTGFQTSFELASSHRLQAAAIAYIGGGQFVDTGNMFGRDVAHRCPHLADTITRQHVHDPGAFAAGAQHTRSGHRPQMMRGVGHTLTDLIGELLDGPFALGEDINDLGAPPTRKSLGDLGECVEECVLGCPVTHVAFSVSLVFKLLLEYQPDKRYIQAII
jgi:hypothetical protein